MNHSVIRTENISKRYHLGLIEKQADTFIGQISQVIRSPWKALKDYINLADLPMRMEQFSRLL